ncbi:MAG: 2,3-bisphosphoglycerate-independent phosphoglycerate mutase [Deltaproteobacteria bacterium]|nr:2,3-bisphosphoglycerate-independent phosphoglycerate mutase [Deltaproteobacteria bacterium]MBW1737578.1 2,3-bisphosphoglycerate-independent phosphoglycerate mutase [Deltaproteobacteria bacterium]MBW1910640.1 2,3-bisphosphoglycerate-independent phosphoglycerate mutase [Deltaproteobacteria bacterium]MBW2034676.1 2,3-bisphosphoglycerate-independent phosphoglycerate mutase [Deltaproteobacteria bacterium]MBW2115173.1 2,3-bisphosphoglycerate-independent phosphoglycerate mutase [Deltaproteobacteria
MSLQLKRLKSFSGRKGPLLLIIMDGVGIGEEYAGNAVYVARTPNLDSLRSSRFYCQLQAHGTAVGLPTDKDMGNSEVGHNAFGAGRVFDQGALLVNQAIETGRIFETEVWSNIVRRVKNGGTLHFIGLLSDGNVHSHIQHLYRLMDKCVELGLERVRLHSLLDGRDVGERSALEYVVPMEQRLGKISGEKGLDYCFASGGGRMKVTMDRYNADWSIVKRGWEAHVLGKGRSFRSAEEAVRTFYNEDPEITDQYMGAFVIVDQKGRPVGSIADGDAVINFNFRGDRAIEISRAFTEKDFREFDRGPLPDVLYAGMMQYDGDTHMPPDFLVQPPAIDRTVGEYLCAEKIGSFAISETQKFGHVTYFWNGNRSGYIDESLETYVEIPSDRVEFDKAPKMKALEIKDRTIEMLKTGKYRFGRLNFANGDMVGHTGNLEATVTAVETVDRCVGELLEVIEALEGIAIVTSDHGNSDEMFTIDENGQKKVLTAHTLNPVPFAIYDPGYNGEYEMAFLKKAGLSSVAATLLNLLGYEKVNDYDPSLIRMITN